MSKNEFGNEHVTPNEARLFDCLERTYMGYKDHNESQFHFLDRLAGRESDDVRMTLDSWFARLPEEKRRDIRERFRKDDRQHHGALLELVTHEVLCAVGADVVVEPDLDGMAPDFSIALNGATVLVECTVSQDSDKKFNATQRKGEVKNIVDSTETGNYFLEWEEPTVGNRNFPGRLLRKKLETWVASLNPSEMAQPQSFVWRHEGWKFRFRASWGRPDELIGTGTRAIGTQIRVEAVGDDCQLAKSLEKKAKKYRNVTSPYLIVVGAGTWFSHTGAIFHALFGRDVLRDPESFWGSRLKSRNCHVSAVLYKPLNPFTSVWGLCHPEMPWEIVHNPWAASPLKRGMFSFAIEWNLESGNFARVEPTCTLNDVLELPDPWPRRRS